MGSQLGSVSFEDEAQVEQEEVSEVQMQEKVEVFITFEAILRDFKCFFGDFSVISKGF